MYFLQQHHLIQHRQPFNQIFENLGQFTGALGADGKADIESVTVEFNATTHKAVTKANYKSGSTVKYKIKDVEATL